MTQNKYNDCLETMFSLRRFGIKLDLSTIKGILNGIGSPQNKFKSIHIAGTNGKGSVASTLSTILISAGYKTGLYTSPHLIKFNERICINNTPISDDEVVELYNSVKENQEGEREATFFEATTAMALSAFDKHHVDFAIIETGMGGRLDATNIINPIVSIITNISLEHQEYLGDTIEQIAGEKGGIIKPNTPVVTAVDQDSVIDVLESIAITNNSPFYLYNKNFSVEKNNNQNTFNYSGLDHNWNEMETGLNGSYQMVNAAIILAACEILLSHDINIPVDNIKSGLKNNKWPGRLEVISSSPLVILDGAHNIQSAQELSKYLTDNLSERHITLIIGILEDKPYHEMLKLLLEPCDSVILTQPKIYRSLEPKKLYDEAKKFVPDVITIPDVEDAIEYALKNAKDAICIAGSLYVVGEAKEAFNKLFAKPPLSL